MGTGKSAATPPGAGTSTSEPGTSLRPAVPWLVATLVLGVAAVVMVLMPAFVGLASGLALFATLLLVRAQGHARLVTPLSAMGFVIGGGIALTSIAQYLSDDAVPPPWAFWALLAGIVVTTVWVVVASVRAGRESTDDREGWMLGGLLYADPDDPDVFVPKRAGAGVTVNLGRPLGWLVMAAVLLPAVVLVVGVALWT